MLGGACLLDPLLVGARRGAWWYAAEFLAARTRSASNSKDKAHISITLRLTMTPFYFDRNPIRFESFDGLDAWHISQHATSEYAIFSNSVSRTLAPGQDYIMLKILVVRVCPPAHL